MCDHRILEGRVVIITGASRGLGRELSLTFSDQGAHVGLLARDIAALEEVSSQLANPSIAVPCDIATPRSLEDAFAKVNATMGRVDAVIANAGIAAPSSKAQNLSVTEWTRALDVNLTGSFLTAQAAYPYLARTGHGRLVLMSSVMAAIPRPGLAAYAATKAGIEGLTRALAVDWARDSICVNAIAPGFFDAGLGTAFKNSERLRDAVHRRTLLGRFGEPRELAMLASFLVSSASGYLTGQTLGIDGGYGRA
ncbi:3-oxoacyl-[acyl-carrier protein] reductase/2-deoxy-D-gluconate 3-dehydrogenase [Prauserella shujinwangii]|uniref:3-oxoacyl-[acyl-carrier protein] reductase/2-deoxy-D-gluconate 3-dehydrogenase n=1 Tax=Prauserella shujinwangii TaxID=1453103 RepID=A0A2T0M0H0_9PSEU|nr:SDR family NAD(P)-dependent oxidoreductase [Prauserella shujinwangii]PRX50095.1 3-oxoacyl-[acyl-carrier protein] reductase/2-deoxy-D-gluconate 3-dehydrogenase [Prauserella shujinwangii]